ncbi:MAG: hypothetical protein AVDCRST_MAG67-2073, partial [uncultured Solirubrobacteraceae bacterium]
DRRSSAGRRSALQRPLLEPRVHDRCRRPRSSPAPVDGLRRLRL